MNIIEKLIEIGIASNPFQAAHIANGLQLAECKTDEERLTRAKLYRDWRNAGEPSKVAYLKAIAGDKVEALIPEVLHSEKEPTVKELIMESEWDFDPDTEPLRDDEFNER